MGHACFGSGRPAPALLQTMTIIIISGIFWAVFLLSPYPLQVAFGGATPLASGLWHSASGRLFFRMHLLLQKPLPPIAQCPEKYESRGGGAIKVPVACIHYAFPKISPAMASQFRFENSAYLFIPLLCPLAKERRSSAESRNAGGLCEGGLS